MTVTVELYIVLFLLNSIVITKGDSQWPQGDYMLPKSIYGCPDPNTDSWHYGYMNITFKQTIQLFESSLGKIGWNGTDLDLLELLGPYGQHSIQLNFCSHPDSGDTNETEWPSGRYGIYGTMRGCPSGFIKLRINKTLPEVLYVNQDGYLPDIHIYRDYDNTSVVSFKTCQRLSIDCLIKLRNYRFTELRINKTLPEVLYVNIDGYLPDINIYRDDTNTSVVSFKTCQRISNNKNDDLSEEFKNFTFPFIILAPQEEQQNFSDDDLVTSRKLFFLSATDDNGTTMRYDWINYYSFGRTDKNVTVEEQAYLDQYMSNATISYASEVLYSLGCCRHVIYPRHGTQFECGCKDSIVTGSVQISTWNEDIWILYSIGTSITVSGIGIWSGYYLDFVTRPEEAEAIPYVYVSGQKWGFLQNDALQCLQEVHAKTFVYTTDTGYEKRPWVLIKCLNNPVGRYVAFVFPKRTNIFENVKKFFVEGKNIKLFISLKVAPKCNRPLGMREGGVFDAFLTASSAHHDYPPHQARPYGRGWCAQKDDSKPFLQMDLSMPHQIEGIQIFNWPKGTMYRMTSPLEGRTVGVYSFSIQYGFSESSLSSLNREFHIDPFLPAEHAQTVWLAAPLDTRYLRIFPLKQMDDSALNCLRLEVIGCPVSARFLELLNGELSSFTRLTWEDKHQYNPGILKSSFSHPFHYPTGTAHTWTISSAKGQFINFLLSDFSLNIYKMINGSDSNTNPVCTDTVYLYPFAYSASFMHMWYLMEFIESGRLEDPDVLQPIVLTSSQNDQQLSYKVNVNTVNIVFRTCPDVYPIETHGRGFRMLAYPSGTPTCLRWDYASSYRKGCSWEEAKLASTSFLGIFFRHSEFNFWKFSFNCDYIVLQLTDFDVGCDTGTTFELSDGRKTSRYCNKNKPVNEINSTYDVLEIKFQTKLCESHVLVEGFRGSYKAEFMNKSVSNLTTLVERGTDLLKYYSDRVCSEELSKCYIIVDLTKIKYVNPNLTEISWDMFNDMVCRQHGWTMISVHSRTEQEFIRVWTKYVIDIELVVSNPDGYNGYVYLGLRGMQDKFVWSDDSPITFEAWGPGEPSKSRKLDCTRLNVRSWSTDITWESVSCDVMKAEVGVCEYPMRNISEKSTCGFQTVPSEHPSFRPENNMTTHDLDEDLTRLELSRYFQCGDGEIISILGKCDGKRDCANGRDEDHCQNSSICKVTEYRCDDGSCIDVSTLCDYTMDCINGEDEECSFPECGVAEFTCDSKMCIDMRMRCDGKPDCSFGEDETMCSSCNSSTSFNCGDNTCIPISYRCDGRPDCQTGEDEKTCVKPNTCQEWWNAGYRDNGMYSIHDEDMECDFNNIETSGKIITKYHNIDFLGDEGKRSDRRLVLQYGSLSALRFLISSYMCYQSVDQLCQPWIQELYEIDNNLKDDQQQLCQCIRYVKWLTEDRLSYYEDCNGSATSGYHSVLSFRGYSNLQYIETIEHDSNDEDKLANIRIRINPVTCYSDFIPQLPDIVCGNGMTVPHEIRCLYKLTDFGTMVGCRNLVHLQGCECFQCPDGYFKCPGSFCLESRFVCDGHLNCQNGEDEDNCGPPAQVCVSQYRCLQSNICLPLQYLCDGYRQCPFGDDERLCNFRCPEGCNCTGMTADCRMAKINNASDISLIYHARYLDISTNGDIFTFLTQFNKQLIFLSVFNMSFCGITDISSNFFVSMRNLLILDMSYNNIHVIKSHTFVSQRRLTKLNLAGNTEIHVIEQRAFEGLVSLVDFELSHVHIGSVSKGAFKTLNVQVFDMSNNVIDSIENQGFDGMTVENVFLNDTEIKSFDVEMFSGIEISHQLITGAYMFCCIRPQKFPEESCYPHKDEFSSCSDLMRNDALRALLWTIGLFSLLGNSASLIYRFLYDRERLKLGYGIFVSNLAFTDFLMGVYLITIASADVAFRGTYTYNEKYWRNSGWCKMAGVLSTISSEGSVLFICLITIDRLLVIKYPFGQIRFTTKSAVVVSCMVWFTVALIAVLPIFVTSYFYDSFYSKTGVCLALPLTRDRPPGWVYSISVFIGFNFVAFLAIAFGQWLIYSTINKTRSLIKQVSKSRIRDLRVARNLLLVATTDFLCWFPVGILGILALTGHVIPGDVYAWVAVLVLPINSALNPFLYTLSTILTRGKFTPATSEQARDPDMQSSLSCVDTNVEKIRLKRALDRLLDLWNSRLLILPMLTESFVPLPEYISSGRFNLQKCLRTTVTITKCLILLHERDLSHSNLSIENVYVKPANKRSFNVALSAHPRIVSTDGEKHDDVEKFGKLLETLLKKCQVADRKVEALRNTENFSQVTPY